MTELEFYAMNEANEIVKSFLDRRLNIDTLRRNEEPYFLDMIELMVKKAKKNQKKYCKLESERTLLYESTDYTKDKESILNDDIYMNNRDSLILYNNIINQLVNFRNKNEKIVDIYLNN